MSSVADSTPSVEGAGADQPASATFPVTVRCTSLGAALASNDLDAALSRALGRALDRANTVFADRQLAIGLVTLGPRVAQMPGADELRARVDAVLASLVLSRIPAARLAPLPAPPAERFDPSRFDPQSGTYTIPSYDGGKAKVGITRTDEPFKEVLAQLRLTIEATNDLLKQIGIVKDTSSEREAAIAYVAKQLQRGRDELAATQLVADVLAGRVPSSPTGKNPAADERVQYYYRKGQDFPVRAVVNARIQELASRRIYIAVIRQHCGELDDSAMLAARDTPVRTGFFVVSALYLNTLQLSLEELPKQLAFLDTLYREPETIVGFAVAKWAARYVRDYWNDLDKMVHLGQSAYAVATLGPIEQAKKFDEPYGVNPYDRDVAFAFVGNLLRDLYGLIASFGETFPARPAEVKDIPTARDTKTMAALTLHIMIDIPILQIWTPLEALRQALRDVASAGEHLYQLGESDRDKWFREINDLRVMFSKEIFAQEHADKVRTDIPEWEKRVQTLCTDIPPEVKRSKIIAAAAEQIPFLLVGGAIAKGAGEAVELIWGESRLLRIFAEGAALTAFNTVLALPKGNVTVGSVVTNLVVNIGFAGLGTAIGAFAGDIGQGLVGVRRALVAYGGVAITTVTLTAIQTAMTAIEDDAKKNDGDSELTTVFTTDLALNALGLLFGASYGRTKKSLPRGLVVADDAALAKVLSISEAAAAAWRHYEDRTAAFQERARKISADFQAGRASIADMEALRKEALGLIDEMLPVVPEIAKFLEGAGDPATIRAGLQRMRDAVAKATFRSAGPAYATPETLQIERIGESDTFVYDPDDARQKLKAEVLRRTLRLRGWTITQEQGGGFRALPPGPGARPITLLPAGRAIRGLLPAPTLGTMSRGEPQASAGLANLRAQTAVPGLEALVAPALARVPAPRAIAFLRALRLIDPGINAEPHLWRGLERYLRLGGDLGALSRAMTRRNSRSEQAEQQLVTRKLLGQISDPRSGWDESAARGLTALFEMVPTLTAERFGDLVTNPEPVQVAGTLQALDVLSHRVTGVSDVVKQMAASWAGLGPYNRNAAAAVLHGAIEITQRFPNTVIGFEVPSPGPNASFERFQDLTAYELVPTPGGGPPGKRAIFRLEYKDVLPASIDAHVRLQFARDIILDYNDRLKAGTTARPPYAGFGWRFGRDKLMAAAVARIGHPNPTPREIDAALRDVVRDRLRDAFTLPALTNAVPAADITAYRQAFDAQLRFVEFF